MAENTFKSNSFKKPEKEKKAKSTKSKFKFEFSFYKDPRFTLALGFFLLITSLFLFTAFLSYLFTGKADQSVVESWMNNIVESGQEAENWLGLFGAIMSHYLIFKWMGISAFFIPPLLFFLGFRLVFKRDLVSLFSAFIFSVFAGLWLSLLLGYITHSMAGVNEVGFISGGLGYELAKISDGLFGWGTFLILVLTLFIFIIYYFNITAINAFQVKDPKPMGLDAILPDDDLKIKPTYTDDRDNWPVQTDDEIPEPVLIVKEPVREID
jgi:S-DNA-T family DNA segregation ATPase FtsK/SpoIIIE